MDKRTFLKTTLKGSLAITGGISLLSKAATVLAGTAKSNQLGVFVPAPLPYAYDALEPHIDARTMEIHYTKHHMAYVEKLNAAVAKAGASLSFSNLNELLAKYAGSNTDIRNQGGGHWNHEFFWLLLAPKATTPSKELLAAINKHFKSLDNFKAEFNKTALGQFGSGWAWLCYSPTEKALFIQSTANQDNPLMQLPEYKSGIPIIGVDVWEHAYYLKYQNRRADYLNAFWKVLNWEWASFQYREALKQK